MILRAMLLGTILVSIPREAAAGAAQGSAASHLPTVGQSAEERARNYFTDLPVVTHEGKHLRFYSDVLKDRVVAITFFYTNCHGMCPIVNQMLSKVQALLGDRFGKDIFLITISVDPENDTPEALAAYRKKFEARDGWIFLTGEKADIDTVTYRLGQTLPKEAHSPLILLGNVKQAHWRKLRPNMPAPVIAQQLETLADSTGLGE